MFNTGSIVPDITYLLQTKTHKSKSVPQFIEKKIVDMEGVITYFLDYLKQGHVVVIVTTGTCLDAVSLPSPYTILSCKYLSHRV